MEYFVARDEDSTLWIYDKEPDKNILWGHWDNRIGSRYQIPKSLFPTVKWEDNQATKISY